VKIGDVAKQLNMPPSTIRYYEKRGLIPTPGRVSGRREFDKSALANLRFIQLCQAAGFSISEISSLIEQFSNAQSNTGVCQPAVVSKRNEIQHQIKQLQQMDAVLSEMTKCRCSSIEQCIGFALEC